MNLDLDLLQYQTRLVIKTIDGKRHIWDPIRKKNLVLTPEEHVRQLVVCYFLEHKNVSKNRIALERALKVNKMTKRWDLLIYEQHLSPWLLVECKAPDVNISQAVFEQISIYNLQLRVPYLMVTNGRHTYCCEMDYKGETFKFLETVPDFV